MSKAKLHNKVIRLIVTLALVLSFSLVTTVPVLAMPGPVVTSVTETAFGTNTIDHYVNMPATVNAGDLLIVLFTNDGISTVTTPAGWSLLASERRGLAVRLSAYYKIAAGDEDGTTVNFVTSMSEEAAAQVYRITNWHGTTPPEISTAATGINTAPDPDSLNPAGWDVEDTLWIAVAGQDQGDQSGTTDYPASYTDGVSTLSSDGSGSCRTLSARRVLAVASEDPGAFTIPVADEWVAFTIAVRPAPCDLTISSTEGGSVTEPGEGTFSYGEEAVVNLVATPDEGYRFGEWTGNVSTIADIYAAATNITMNGDYSITAEFIKRHDLTINSTEGGSVTTPGEGTFTYDEGTVVHLVAEADEGYQFVEWTGNVSTIADVEATATNITMCGNYSITAEFEEIPPPPDEPTVTTQDATDISTSSATLNMNYTLGDFSQVEVRFAYKKSTDSAWSYTDWVSKTTDGTHAESLSELDSDTGYEFTAQLKYNDTIEGTSLQFTTDKSSTPPPSGGCFIATAAYGTSMAEEIQILREFRDKYLLTNPVGQTLVDIYYRSSPPVAEFITEHPSLKPIVRAGLVPAVSMSTIAVNTTLAEKIAIISLLVLVSVAVAIWATRRRDGGPQYT
jgi:hypothetical protein